VDVNQIMQTVTTIAIAFGLKILGAIVVWVVGRYLIGLAVRLVSNALERQRVDPTVLRYLGTVISVTLNIILVIAILGYFGVETTTFAALFAAAGVAIGLAWSDLLANFAGPVLAVRPYCHTDHYWQVYFDVNKVIRESFGAARFPAPEQHLVVRNSDASAADA
jgi:small conductance mechanosensitive channel